MYCFVCTLETGRSLRRGLHIFLQVASDIEHRMTSTPNFQVRLMMARKNLMGISTNMRRFVTQHYAIVLACYLRHSRTKLSVFIMFILGLQPKIVRHTLLLVCHHILFVLIFGPLTVSYSC